MYGIKSNYTGFSLLEILVALFIMALLTSLAIPNLQQRTPKMEREQFVAQLNSLCEFGWQQALITQKVHRIHINLKTRRISLQQQLPDKQNEFTPLKAPLIESDFEYGEQFEIKQFIIEGYDELKRFAGGITDTVWFYLVPSGLAQQVHIVFRDKKDIKNGRPYVTTLHINPFNSQFKVV